MLLLELPGLSCVVSHDEVEAIGASDTADAAVDLDRELGLAAARGSGARGLAVGVGGERVVCATRATMRILGGSAAVLYALPRVLRESGCAPWLRGLAVLGTTDQDDGQARLGLWLDLRALVRGLGHGTTA